MRFTPFGSGSYDFTFSASRADFALNASRALRTPSAQYAISGSKGMRGDDGDACTTTPNPYESYPPTYVAP